ncbi:unnamed protein product [Protopolystoma xenopodis]|uniref:Uncharacterized protein n=1 Tax=Protopolystoma xenopodis TaxID=117903 RepID=A0A448XC45_9PLAT|nr:unnamed protein product [Protopolystoma xenopodis]
MIKRIKATSQNLEDQEDFDSDDNLPLDPGPMILTDLQRSLLDQLICFVITGYSHPTFNTEPLKASYLATETNTSQHDQNSTHSVSLGDAFHISDLSHSSIQSGTNSSPTLRPLRPDHITLGKADCLNYLIDLVISYQSVAEYVAKYRFFSQNTHTLSKQVSDGVAPSNPQIFSFLAYVFAYLLKEEDTSELATTLLENLVLVSSEATQALIINEYKASLTSIATGYLHIPDMTSTSAHKTFAITSPGLSSLYKNDRLTAHMRFLDRLLLLPAPLVSRVIHLIYKRKLPCDIAKLIAHVDCNLANSNSTMIMLVRALENLTWIDRIITKRISAIHQSQNVNPMLPDGIRPGLRRRDRPLLTSRGAPHLNNAIFISHDLNAESNSRRDAHLQPAQSSLDHEEETDSESETEYDCCGENNGAIAENMEASGAPTILTSDQVMSQIDPRDSRINISLGSVLLTQATVAGLAMLPIEPNSLRRSQGLRSSFTHRRHDGSSNTWRTLDPNSSVTVHCSTDNVENTVRDAIGSHLEEDGGDDDDEDEGDGDDDDDEDDGDEDDDDDDDDDDEGDVGAGDDLDNEAVPIAGSAVLFRGEDEGSAGQGGDAENSQDEDEDDTAGNNIRELECNLAGDNVTSPIESIANDEGSILSICLLVFIA